MLLANIIHNPEQDMARADMELVGPLLRLLDCLAENARTEDINRIRKFCMELERRATIALGKAQIKDIATPHRKRKLDSITSQDLTPDLFALEWLDSKAETAPSLVEAPRALDLAAVCLLSLSWAILPSPYRLLTITDNQHRTTGFPHRRYYKYYRLGEAVPRIGYSSRSRPRWVQPG